MKVSVKNITQNSVKVEVCHVIKKCPIFPANGVPVLLAPLEFSEARLWTPNIYYTLNLGDKLRV